MKFKSLACLMIAGVCLFTYSLPSESFAATKGHWAVPALESLQSQNLFLGIKKDAKSLETKMVVVEFESLLDAIWDSEFGVFIVKQVIGSTHARDYLTRQEAAEIIYEAINPNKEGDAIDWIKSAKIMSGYPSGDFKPNDKVTLAQGVTIMSHVKAYLKAHPELKLSQNSSQGPTHSKDSPLTYIATANAKGTIDFTLSWGEKKTGGYSVEITKVVQSGKELRISYKLTSPGPDDIVTQALTYPKDTVNLEMGMEAYKQLTLILVEDQGLTTQEK